MRHDQIIRSTDIDALVSKYSACQKGYLEDPYIEKFVQAIKAEGPRTAAQFTPKLPLINRGTYVRQCSISTLIDDFLSNGGKQIVSLGAGSDTRPFSILSKYPSLVIHELDFADSTRRKAKIIRSDPSLSSAVGLDGSSDEGGDEIHTERYHLHACDLRKLTLEITQLQAIAPNEPTLILSECCLCYLSLLEIDRVMEWIKNTFKGQLAMVLYEPIGGNDQFGQVMIENLAQRGISLPTLNKYPTIESQLQRMKQWGFTHSFVANFQYVHDKWLDEQERERIDRLEFLDEREEMTLLLEHYCIAWGSTSSDAAWNPAWSKLNQLES